VDPYYLTHKAEAIGYHPEMILAGRRLNDNMAGYAASQVVKLMIRKGIQPARSRILVLGLTFKENCPDIRNTKVVDMVAELRSYSADVSVFDPWADPGQVHEEYGFDLVDEPDKGAYDAIVIAVAHDRIRALGAAGIHALGRDPHVVYDLKHVLNKQEADGRL
jgi:UDP-N-acetyl-D-galactosamine dehydrogenase